MNIDKKFLKQAVKQARTSMQKGGFPAGAVLVNDGKVISKGISLGNKLNDPTEHSETSCIKKACKKLKTTNLKNCILYASLQPCLMCFSVANWTSIPRIVYGCKKTEEMVASGCYEGTNDLININNKNNHKIELVYMSDFEGENMSMIKEWKNS
ncbi:MAG: hypothetical protein UR66_C0005G0034 [Candidatus Moranbacteria bacterium GW2011_GWE1_35_17]|nr:MAG: hypothetical protein UR65_C0076G0002 [Candidatus Moranbacteria bacterium GW2011_GWE2_35_164]KKP68487.1 MAG: hypothetical protein UR66_C0005G0034 [Candidatus Moranbacteria bacterium GW2011_GWE1_35_17]KKP84033.1 MAG: hypothetical protein UR82_C0014G0012 [Candidatus Moranbacteria bacterium GW2011_GWF1_35_5]